MMRNGKVCLLGKNLQAILHILIIYMLFFIHLLVGEIWKYSGRSIVIISRGHYVYNMFIIPEVRSNTPGEDRIYLVRIKQLAPVGRKGLMTLINMLDCFYLYDLLYPIRFSP